MTQVERYIPKNRTGIATSRELASEMIAGTAEFGPSSPGSEAEIAAVRTAYAADAEAAGSVPPPATMKGALSTVVKAVKHEKPLVFIDILGARLAFERSGTRLYEALLSKFDAFGSFEGGPTRPELERFHQHELDHFLMLVGVIRELGGDPTAITPAADVEAMISRGALEVVGDPRLDLIDSLHALHTAELHDTDSWGLLVEAARVADRADLMQAFSDAMLEEQAHLDHVRNWLKASLRV
jgi:hypothetical protein